MKKITRRSFIKTAGVVAAMASVAGCSNSSSSQTVSDASSTVSSSADVADNVADDGAVTGEITVWSSLSQDEMDMYASIYNSINPNVKVNSIPVPSDTYITKLQASLRAGAGAPDVMLLDVGTFGSFNETDFLENLSAEPYNAASEEANIIPYVAQVSKDSEGNYKGLSYQACPGGFWFNKALAKEYLGTDDPDELQILIQDWDAVVDAGITVHEASGGTAYLLDGFTSIITPLRYDNGAVYVSDDGTLKDFTPMFEQAKEIRDNNGDAKLDIGSVAWAAAIYEDPCFILLGRPSWALHYDIKANIPSDATDTDNTWGFVPAPQSYQSGGTYLAMWSASENKDAAWDYIKTVTLNEEYLVQYVETTGDMISYIPAIENIIAGGFRDSVTGDQDIYSYLYQVAKEVNAKPTTAYDAAIDPAVASQLKLVLAGELTVEEGIAAFEKDMKTQYPELIIE